MLPETNTRPLEQLQQAFNVAPDNYGSGYQLYREQMRQGKTDDALMISGFTLIFCFATSAAASKTARACISVISG